MLDVIQKVEKDSTSRVYQALDERIAPIDYRD